MASWFYREGNELQGPLTGAELKMFAASGQIMPDTVVETEDGRKSLARNVKGLFSAADLDSLPMEDSPAEEYEAYQEDEDTATMPTPRPRAASGKYSPKRPTSKSAHSKSKLDSPIDRGHLENYVQACGVFTFILVVAAVLQIVGAIVFCVNIINTMGDAAVPIVVGVAFSVLFSMLAIAMVFCTIRMSIEAIKILLRVLANTEVAM